MVFAHKDVQRWRSVQHDSGHDGPLTRRVKNLLHLEGSLVPDVDAGELLRRRHDDVGILFRHTNLQSATPRSPIERG